MITPEDSDITDEVATAAPAATETRVPLAALALEGTAPGAGDAVEFTVGGKITRIEGEFAVVQAETINGEPIPAASTPEDEDAAMMAEASAADASAAKAYG